MAYVLGGNETMFYRLRFGAGLAKLGISYDDLSEYFRVNTPVMAESSGYWPKEAAIYIYFMLPDSMAGGIEKHADRVLAEWLREGKVREHKINEIAYIVNSNGYSNSRSLKRKTF